MLNGLRPCAVCILIVAITGFIVTSAISQEWITFDGVTTTATEPGIEVQESNISRVEFEVAVYGMSVEVVEHEGSTYQRLNIPEYLWSEQVGAPEVPVIRALVAIPECADIILEVTTTDSTMRDNFKVYPVPELVDDESSDGFLKERFTLNTDLYAANAFYPGKKAEVLTTGYIRDQRIAQVAVYPVQFNPVSDLIRAYFHFQVQLSFTSPSGTLLKNVGPFEKICRSNIINYE